MYTQRTMTPSEREHVQDLIAHAGYRLYADHVIAGALVPFVVLGAIVVFLHKITFFDISISSLILAVLLVSFGYSICAELRLVVKEKARKAVYESELDHNVVEECGFCVLAAARVSGRYSHGGADYFFRIAPDEAVLL